MAKENSILMLQGNIGNFSFYKTKEGSMVRMKGGVDRNRILNDPKFARTRENMAEFGIIAQTGRILRTSLSNYVRKISDHKASNRMTSLLTKLKLLDDISIRGERSPAVGIAIPEGKAILENFDFNAQSQLKSVLTVPYALDESTGIFSIADFAPRQSILLPKEATHVQIGIAVAGLDAELKVSETVYSPLTSLSADAPVAMLTVDPGGLPTLQDVTLFCLLIEFLQEINGVQYPLHNNQFNCLNILKVV